MRNLEFIHIFFVVALATVGIVSLMSGQWLLAVPFFALSGVIFHGGVTGRL